MENKCRLCLEKSENKEPLYIKKEMNGEYISFTTMIALCTGLEIFQCDLSMPGYICTKCSSDLFAAFSFRQRCWNSNERLQKLLIPPDLAISIEKVDFPEFDDTNFSYDDEDETNNDHLFEKVKPLHGCDQCNKKFKKKYDLTIHLRTHTGERPFKCSLCDMTFKRSTELNAHNKLHTGQTYKCTFCDYNTNYSYLLKKHVFGRHPNKKTIFMQTHKAKKPIKKTPTCEICNKTFKKKETLKSHIRTHTGEKPYACELCEYRSAHSNGLRLHMRLHTGERKFVCEHCGLKFRASSVLIAHRRIHSDEKPYKCPTCPKSFRFSSSLNQHVTIHDASKKIICEFCGKKYTKKAILIHKKSHTGERPYVCDTCGKGFIQKYSLKTHMKNIHPNLLNTNFDKKKPETTSPENNHIEMDAINLAGSAAPTQNIELVPKDEINEKTTTAVEHLEIELNEMLTADLFEATSSKYEHNGQTDIIKKNNKQSRKKIK